MSATSRLGRPSVFLVLAIATAGVGGAGPVLSEAQARSAIGVTRPSERAEVPVRADEDEAVGQAHPCTVGGNDPDKVDEEKAEYSDACAAYLEQCTQLAWFWSAAELLAESFQTVDVEQWYPIGVGADATTRRGIVNERARHIQSFYEDGTVDARYAKALGVGFRHHTYLGVYNCRSRYEKTHADTGCPLFDLLAPTQPAENRQYLGTVRNWSESSSDCESIDTTDDAYLISCLPKLDRSTDCAFEVWPWELVAVEGNLWGYFCTQRQPGFSFDPTLRGWFETARAAFDAGSPSGEPLFLRPYVNYSTGEPVFGVAAPFADSTGEFAGVALALEYLFDEPTYQTYVPECDATSVAWHPDFALTPPPAGD